MKTNFFKMAAALMLGFAMMVACNPEEKADKGPGFPKLIERHDLLAGDTLSITFTPKHDWEIQSDVDKFQWFWLEMEGEDYKTDYISGPASKKPVTVYVVVNSVEEYNESRSVEVTMSMNGKTQTVAKLTRPAKVRSIKVYTAKLDKQGFVYSNSGDLQFKYEETKAESFALVWPEPTAACMMRILLETNVEWIMTYPEWLKYRGIDEDVYGIRGMHEFRFEVEPSKHPLDGAEGKIVFKSDDDSDYKVEIDVTVPPAKEKLYVEIYNYIVKPLSFNSYGQCETMYDYLEGDQIIGSMLSTKGAKVFAALMNADGTYSTSETPWVNVQLSSWDESDGADVIQDRSVEVVVNQNEGEERKAMLFLLPENLSDKTLADILNADMATVREEYADYAYELTQDAAPTGNEPVIEVNGNLSSVSAEFKAWGEEDLASRFKVPVTDCYKMTYGTTWGSDEANMRMTKKWSAIEVYDDKYEKIATYDQNGESDVKDFWLKISVTVGQVSIQIPQDRAQQSEGYVKIIGEDGNGIALVWFVFNPSFVPTDPVTVEFIGETAPYAEMKGASLAEVTSGEYFEAYKDYGCPIYKLIYKDLEPEMHMPMIVSLPAYTSAETVPSSKKDGFSAEQTTGGATIKMDPGKADSAVIVFYSNQDPCFVLVCEYAPEA